MMLAISLVFALLLVWLGLTGLLIVLLIYRGVLSTREEDQLFLDPGEVHLEREMREVVGKLERLSPYIWGAFIAWVVVGLGTFGLWVWQQLR
ncbi:MAG: hypothetical protein HY653_00320 [Acidobacteria bacterium]|nr:hypothetical protein [Acidobacteriota bacterium]